MRRFHINRDPISGDPARQPTLPKPVVKVTYHLTSPWIGGADMEKVFDDHEAAVRHCKVVGTKAWDLGERDVRLSVESSVGSVSFIWTHKPENLIR